MWIRHFNNDKQECDFPLKEIGKKANQRQQTNKKRENRMKRSVLLVLNVLKQDCKIQNKNCIDALMIFKGEIINIISCGSNQLFLFPLHKRHAQS